MQGLDEPATVISADLYRGERLLWSGQPRQGIVFHSSDAAIIPFSLIWAAVAFGWEASVLLQDKINLYHALYGIPFVIAGFYMLVGRFPVELLIRRKTYYGVTDRRVIIRSILRTNPLRSFRLKSLPSLALKENKAGGEILLAPTKIGADAFAVEGWPGLQSTASLDVAADARTVFELIQRARADSESRIPGF